MTWGEFKQMLAEQGVTDEMEIQWIDVGYDPAGAEATVEGEVFWVRD